MFKKNLIIVLIFITIHGYGQFDEDVFSFNYAMAPIGNDGIDFYKTDLKLRLPFTLKKGILVNLVSFDYYQINYNDIIFNTENINQFYKINYDLMYVHPISNKWSLSSRVGVSLSSNLTEQISSEDIFYKGSIKVLKKGGSLEKPSRFSFGLGYVNFTGKPRVVPLLSYTKKVTEKISYSIGFPKTYINYKINIQHSIKSSLSWDGFYANIGNSTNSTLDNEIDKASYRAIFFGIEYGYQMSDIMAITFKSSYSFNNNYRLLDSNNNSVYNFNINPKLYFSAGIKYNLKNKSKNRNKNEKQ